MEGGAREGPGDLAPKYGGLGAAPPAGVQGAEPPLGGLGGKPQKLKPKNGLDASQKGFGEIKCQVS